MPWADPEYYADDEQSYDEGYDDSSDDENYWLDYNDEFEPLTQSVLNGQYAMYAPGEDIPDDYDTLDFNPDEGVFYYRPPGEESDPSLDSFALESTAPVDPSSTPEDFSVGSLAPTVGELPGPRLNLDPVDAMDPDYSTYTPSTTARPDYYGQLMNDEPEPEEQTNWLDQMSSFIGGLMARNPMPPTPSPDAPTQIEPSPIDQVYPDLAPSPQAAMEQIAYQRGEGDEQIIDPDSGATPIQQGANPIPENLIYQAWENLSANVFPAVGAVLGTLGASQEVTSPFVRELMSIETPLGTTGDLAAKAQLVKLGAMAGPPGVAVAGSIALAHTLATAPITNALAERIMKGEISQFTDDILAQGSKMQASAAKALEMEQVHWDRLQEHILQPVSDSLSSDPMHAASTFSEGIHRMAEMEHDEYQTRKANGEDPGFLAEVMSDIYGTPQLGLINKIPGVNQALEAPFRQLERLAEKIPQTPVGAGLLAARNSMVAFGGALGLSGDDAVQELARRNDPQSVVNLVKRITSGAENLTEEEFMFGQALSKYDGMAPRLVAMAENAVAENKPLKDVMLGFDRAVHDVAAAERSEELRQVGERMPGLVRAAGHVLKPGVDLYQWATGTVGRGMSTMYLATASYLYGNPVESFARAWIGGARGGVMDAQTYRRHGALFMNHVPAELSIDDTVQSPITAVKKNFIENVPLLGQAQDFIIGKANQIEGSIRRDYVIDRAFKRFQELVYGSTPEIKAYWKGLDPIFGDALKGLRPDIRAAAMNELKHGAMAGAPAMKALENLWMTGQFNGARAAEVLARFDGPKEVMAPLARALEVGSAKDLGIYVDDVDWKKMVEAQQAARRIPAERSVIIETGEAAASDITSAAAKAGQGAVENVPVDYTGRAVSQARDKLLQYIHTQRVGRSDLLENQLLPQAEKEFDEFLTKRWDTMSPDMRKQALVQISDGLIQLQRLSGKQSEALMNTLMSIEYHSNKNLDGLGRKLSAHRAFGESTELLDRLSGRISKMAERVRPVLDDYGLSGNLGHLDDYAAVLRGKHGALVDATTSAWQDMRAGKIRRADLMEAIRQRKDSAALEWGQREQEMLRRVSTGSVDIAGQGARFRRWGPVADRHGQEINLPDLIPENASINPRYAQLPVGNAFKKTGAFDDVVDATMHDFDSMVEELQHLVRTDPRNNPAMAQGLGHAFAQAQQAWAQLNPQHQQLAAHMLAQAGDKASADLRLEFPMYDSLNYLTAFAQSIFPFARYEWFRVPYLSKTALTNLELIPVWNDFWDRSDEGYLRLPRMSTMAWLPLVGNDLAGIEQDPVKDAQGVERNTTDFGHWQFFPFGGTIVAGMRSMQRADFPPNSTIEKIAVQTALGNEGRPLEPWEQEWLRRPVLRDVVMMRRLDEVYNEAKNSDAPEYRDMLPEERGVYAVQQIIKRVHEHYGFFQSPIFELPSALREGHGGEIAGPLIKGAADLIEQIPANAPAGLGRLGGIAYDLNKPGGLLADPYVSNQVAHVLADWGVVPSKATDEQMRAAYDAAVRREIWSEQIGGMRYRSPERLKDQEDQKNAWGGSLRGDQIEQLERSTGSSSIEGAQRALRATGQVPEDVLGDVDPRLGLTPEQRDRMKQYEGYGARREANEPFQNEEQKEVTSYFAESQRLKDTAKSRIGTWWQWADRGYDDNGQQFNAAAARKLTSDEIRNMNYARRNLQDSPKFDAIKPYLAENASARRLSVADRMIDGYYKIMSDATDSTGRVNMDKMLNDREQYDRQLETLARDALDNGDNVTWAAFQEYRANASKASDEMRPGFSNALETERRLRMAFPKYRGVPRGEEGLDLQNDIDDAMATYRLYTGSGAGARGFNIAHRDGEVDDETFNLVHRYGSHLNPDHTKWKRLVSFKSDGTLSDYGKWRSNSVGDAEISQKYIQQEARRNPGIMDIIDSFTQF